MRCREKIHTITDTISQVVDDSVVSILNEIIGQAPPQHGTANLITSSTSASSSGLL